MDTMQVSTSGGAVGSAGEEEGGREGGGAIVLDPPRPFRAPRTRPRGQKTKGKAPGENYKLQTTN